MAAQFFAYREVIVRSIPAVLTRSTLVLVFVMLGWGSALGQQDSPDSFQGDRLDPSQLISRRPKGLPDEEPTARMQRALEKKQSEERQLQLKEDTEKLFKLATELKDQVGKTNQNILSLDVVKKAEEIEKLAHSVKEKMRGPS